jgi:ADP-ribosyl-[dinitrogen reductase] hydrolase
MEERLRGCLLGLAIGDALGTPVRFHSRWTFASITGFRAGRTLKAGEWTNGTSMALALADSILSVGWNINDQAHRYVDWWLEGKYSVNGTCFDIGTATKLALSKFRDTLDANTCGCKEDGGNCSIMRLAPVSIAFNTLYPKNTARLDRFAEQSSLVTHASEVCLSACRYMNLVLVGLIHGESRETVLDPEWLPIVESRNNKAFHPLIEDIIRGSYRTKKEKIWGSGWVVESLEAALWAFYDSRDFSECVLRAVNLGDDTSATGAIVGQFAGTYFGESGIPKEWLDDLAGKNLLENALRLCS